MGSDIEELLTIVIREVATIHWAQMRDHLKELSPDAKIRPLAMMPLPFLRLVNSRLRTLVFTEHGENAHEKERRFRE